MNEERFESLERMTPGLRIVDPMLAYWLAQVNLRLRRELTWCWYQRTGQNDPDTGVLPPHTGIADDNLAWARSDGQRRQFFAQDATAAFLSERIQEPAPELRSRYRGDWAWLVTELGLEEADQFVLALAVAHRLDAGLGPVCAACLNDINKAFPTLALAQRLWDEPLTILALAASTHPLRRYGLLETDAVSWQHPLELPAWIAAGLSGGYTDPEGVIEVPPRPRPLPEHWVVPLHVLGEPAHRLRRVPLLGQRDDDFIASCAAIAERLDARLVGVTPAAWQQHRLTELLTWAWLRGVEPVLPWGVTIPAESWPLALPLRVWQPMSPQQYSHDDTGGSLLPPLTLPAIGFHRRLEVLQEVLGSGAAKHHTVVEECARRFRFSEPALRRIATTLRHLGAWQGDDLIEACRHETRGELAQLTQRVEPRFTPDDLVLAAEQQAQFREVARAMEALTEVHYRWGTARVWNESGLAILFCGPPGTGKTMAAEALATRLMLDMYRVDLAQVVSKYVGETEKNLRRIFDAAEASDCLLFFDEADALFGKRTEVKDAHDRYANIEVSYLLERMERFKGLAILASNRRKDMDEAFMRRLRYVIEFPVPGVDERERIWRQGFPAHVDTDGLDFRFLARQFAFSGGHIRSVIFNACLQAAAEPEGEPATGKVGKPSMRQVLVQVKRELQKLNRAADDELFGSYARLLGEETA
ncbi:hypothetical protein GCM10007160_04010 [Litchfieldella qijiaojingensis]|uniref:AAA+ ATPase domain-containing protein n=1 Tax=Litchfieldella qijiaojingensis TaxID=980347 RepID=A0ABQ2YDP6_9GAMM|nr:AAA family ATPase [Halomonas qijiaojingensis]GGX79792.1 hypothetical protein GCM10007160_04010 [Halomonas qijiaojingensis]